jgi:serine/threonine protein kinase
MDRIFVQWRLFVKVKKENYLQQYVFVREIGVGAFGVVAKVQMKHGGLFRAAKTVRAAAIERNSKNKERFMSEIAISMKVDHPNINKLFEVFEWGNQFVLIM